MKFSTTIEPISDPESNKIRRNIRDARTTRSFTAPVWDIDNEDELTVSQFEVTPA
ncbi:hypothetical protein ACV229_28725 [Burkholderia sp. MR1-5-21]